LIKRKEIEIMEVPRGSSVVFSLAGRQKEDERGKVSNSKYFGETGGWNAPLLKKLRRKQKKRKERS
jgi:hypothetical protein